MSSELPQSLIGKMIVFLEFNGSHYLHGRISNVAGMMIEVDDLTNVPNHEMGVLDEEQAKYYLLEKLPPRWINVTAHQFDGFELFDLREMIKRAQELHEHHLQRLERGYY